MSKELFSRHKTKKELSESAKERFALACLILCSIAVLATSCRPGTATPTPTGISYPDLMATAAVQVKLAAEFTPSPTPTLIPTIFDSDRCQLVVSPDVGFCYLGPVKGKPIGEAGIVSCTQVEGNPLDELTFTDESALEASQLLERDRSLLVIDYGEAGYSEVVEMNQRITRTTDGLFIASAGVTREGNVVFSSHLPMSLGSELLDDWPFVDCNTPFGRPQ